MLRAVCLVLLLVLAGCQAPGVPGPADAGAEPTGESPATENGSTAGGGVGEASTGGDAPADPETDRLGWESGYWHNESIAVTPDDGLNESELDAVVARSMARIEVVRRLEFEQSVPVEVITRAEYRNDSGGNHSAALERFDNAKFEALFLVGEEEDSIESQESTRGQSVLGYYSPSEDAIVLVSGSDTPRLDGEGTLAHELVHALQDQQFGLANGTTRTRDAYQGRNGLVEGDASLTQRRYMARCGDQWRCLAPVQGGSGESTESGEGTESGGGGHFGIQFMMYFPYSDGPGFVQALREEGGWAAVNDAYDAVPDGSTEVIDPALYSEWEPAEVSLPDRSNADWERVQPPNRADYARPGQSAIAASLAYTLADGYNRSAVVRPREVINYGPDGNPTADDPFDYGAATADGWAGGKMYVYENGDDAGYVWRTKWQNASEAREFAAGWTAVIDHWGGERVGENEWVIQGSEFADAFRVRRTGDTVTVVNAPERSDLSAVHDA